MSKALQLIKKQGKFMTLKVDAINNSVYTKRYKIDEQMNRKEKILKFSSAVGATIGIIGMMPLVLKKNPISLVKNIKNPKQIFNGIKNLELNGLDVMKVASGSVLGGFVGGSIADKENSKEKMKEGITQLIGNSIVPSAFVSSGIKLNGVLNKKFNFPPNNRTFKFISGLASLALGVLFGNKIAKKISKKIFKEDNNHALAHKDWLMQTDNLCLVMTMANPGTKLAQCASKLIPIMHFAPGYLTGTKK